MKILILGASRGIGLEFVRQYGLAGDQVMDSARSEAGLQKIRALGATAFKLDVADPHSVSGLAGQLAGEQIDLAIYVAGVYTQAGATVVPAQAEFDVTLRTNVLGAMQTIPQVAPLVEAAHQGQGCKFIFITSGMGRIGDVESSFGWMYSVSKSSLLSVSLVL